MWYNIECYGSLYNEVEKTQNGLQYKGDKGQIWVKLWTHKSDISQNSQK